MTDKFFVTEHLAHEDGYVSQIEKKKKEREKTELWFLFRGPERSKDFAEMVWKTLQTAYFETLTEESPYDRFEEALKILNAQLGNEDIIHDADFLKQHSFILALFAENALHLSVLGEAEVYLVRQRSLSLISEGLSPHKIEGDVFAHIASGDIEHEDRVLLSQKRLLRHATAAQLADMLSSGVLEGADSLKELLRIADDVASFVLIHVHDIHETLPLPRETKPEVSLPSWKNIPAFLENIPHMAHTFWNKLRSGDQKTFLGAILGALGGLILLLFLFSWGGQSDKAQYDEYKELLTELQRSLATVEEQEILEETDRANANLTKIENDLQAVLTSGLFRSEALMLANKVAEAKDRINKITRISTPKELAPLAFTGTAGLQGVFEYADEWFVFTDADLLRVVFDKVANTLEFPLAGAVKEGAPLADKKQLIFSDGSKVLEYDPEAKRFTTVKTEDITWKKHNALTAYSKYIYFLAPNENQIWKYERLSDGYAKAAPYLTEDYDLSRAISFSIDGNIFVLMNDGSIQKFYQGKKEEYGVTGAPEGALTGAQKIFTADNLDVLLVLNPEKKAVYVFHKSSKALEYTHQIVFENIGTLRDLWVKAPKTLIVADDKKIYEVSL